MICDISVAPPATGPTRETGKAFNIRCTPDIFTGETLNIGVCVISEDGGRIGRVVTDTGRLSCLYGEDNAAGVVQLAQVALCEALQGNESPSPNIVFDVPRPIYSISPLEAIDDLFSSQVTLAIPQQLSPADRLPSSPTNLVISRLYNALRLVDSSAANQIIPSSPQTVVNTRKGTRAVQIALQPPCGGGIVHSAAYQSQTLRAHLLDSMLDLEWAAEAKGLSRLGIFILPPGNWPAHRRQEIDRAIDNIVDRIPTRIHVDVESDLDSMAQRVLSWAA